MTTPTPSAPTVRTAAGVVRGRMEDGIAIFRGVPFSRPPVGALRLAAPAQVEPWSGVRDAAEFGPPPPQTRALGMPATPDDRTDWLTLNVWSPDLGSAALPVMVWIHGGGYVYGWSGDPLFDGATLARGGVVVVTINYRLGAEGFGHFPGAPANRGLLDQVAALRWVQENVAGFGGDPGRVTVFGESAGAGSIAALMAMPAATGLFRRAIVQSVAGVSLTEELAGDIAREIARRLAVPCEAARLRTLAPSRLRDAADEVAAAMPGSTCWGEAAQLRTPFAPVVDGDVLPADPWQALREGVARGVELVVGHTRDEYRLFLLALGERGEITLERADAALDLLAPDPGAFRSAYPEAGPERLYELVHSDRLFRMPSLRLAELQHAHAPTYLYELAWETPALGGALGACHGLGLPLTFGNLSAGAAAFLLGDPPPAAAVELSRRMRAAWTLFAATGDPGWPAYDPIGQRTWVIDTQPAIRPYPERASQLLWERHAFSPIGLAATAATSTGES
jgi:para-nitrobenzyl esterase